MKGGNVSALFLPAALIVVNFIVCDNVTWRGVTYIRARYIPVILSRITSATMNHVLGHTHQFFHNHLPGHISKQINNLTDGIEKLITTIACNFLRGAALLVAAIVVAYFAHPIFCLLLAAWFAFFGSISIFMSKKLVELSNTLASSEAAIMGEVIDTISNQQNVRFFSNKHFERKRIAPFFLAH